MQVEVQEGIIEDLQTKLATAISKVERMKKLLKDVMEEINSDEDEEEEESETDQEESQTDQESDEQCVICLMPVGLCRPVLKCRHSEFHEECLKNWLRSCPECPLCKERVNNLGFE